MSIPESVELSLRPIAGSAPYWPIAHIVADGEESLATLYWDDECFAGFEGDEELAGEDLKPNGWTLHIYAEGGNVEVWGDRPVGSAIEQALGAVRERGKLRDFTYEQSILDELFRVAAAPEAS